MMCFFCGQIHDKWSIKYIDFKNGVVLDINFYLVSTFLNLIFSTYFYIIRKSKQKYERKTVIYTPNLIFYRIELFIRHKTFIIFFFKCQLRIVCRIEMLENLISQLKKKF